MPSAFLFAPPVPLRRYLRITYSYNGALSSEDPMSYNDQEELQERIDRLQAVIAHELNNPGPYLGGYSQDFQPELIRCEALLQARNIMS